MVTRHGHNPLDPAWVKAKDLLVIAWYDMQADIAGTYLPTRYIPFPALSPPLLLLYIVIAVVTTRDNANFILIIFFIRFFSFLKGSFSSLDSSLPYFSDCKEPTTTLARTPTIFGATTAHLSSPIGSNEFGICCAVPSRRTTSFRRLIKYRCARTIYWYL